MQKRILIIISIIVLLGVAVGLTVFVLQKAKTNVNSNANSAVTNTANGNTNKAVNAKTLSDEEKQRIEITRLANIFAEQYGTYNGALTTGTVNGLKELITTSLLTQIQKQANDELASSATSSLSTMVLSTSIKSFTKGTGAVVEVSTLRKQSGAATEANTNATSTTQMLTLGFFFLDNAWKIQSAQWGTPATAPTVNQ